MYVANWMERAGFIFQVFFDSIDIKECLSEKFSIVFRLFQLPVVEAVSERSGPPGRLDLSLGKRLRLKMPYVEILDLCPMLIVLRTARAGHAHDRKCRVDVNLQNIFTHAIHSPGRYIQQRFNEDFKGREGVFGTLSFTISTCYTTSTQEEYHDIAAVSLRPEPSVDDDGSQRSAPRMRKEIGVMTREFPPPIPNTRQRTIFYFDRTDLMAENQVLSEEIKRLTEMVNSLKAIVDAQKPQQPPKTTTPKTERPPPHKHKADYIYHPPGLMTRSKRPKDAGFG
jgi:hypothetical protein